MLLLLFWSSGLERGLAQRKLRQGSFAQPCFDPAHVEEVLSCNGNKPQPYRAVQCCTVLVEMRH